MNLQIKELNYSIEKKKIISDLSINFSKGKIYGILAPNGSGKSTLLKLIASLLPYDKGEMYYEEQKVSSLSRIELSRIFTLTPQQPAVIFNFTCHEIVGMGCYAKKNQIKNSAERIQEALKAVDAWEFRNHFLDQLSGGERQRIYIARALVTECPILLFDEPFTHLDLHYQLKLKTLIQKLPLQEKTILIALHDFRMARELCDEVILLNKGKVELQGLPEEVIQSSLFEEIFGIRSVGNGYTLVT